MARDRPSVSDQKVKQGGHRFQPGQSGNPGGRPRVAQTWRERCRRFLEDEGGWDHLVAIATVNTGDLGACLAAIKLMAEYAYGKPQQHVDLTTGGQPLIKALSPDDMELLELPEP